LKDAKRQDASERLSKLIRVETGLVKSVEIRAKADKQMLEPV